MRAASKLFKEAGWEIKEGKRVNSNTGEQLKFEILLISPAFERIVLPFKKNLERMGIEASVRVVDTSQYVNRIRSFDFERSNKNLFYGQYRRTDSFFENSELASSGLPTPEELAILEPFRKDLPELSLIHI